MSRLAGTTEQGVTWKDTRVSRSYKNWVKVDKPAFSFVEMNMGNNVYLRR